MGAVSTPEVVYLARADTLDVGLLDNVEQRLLRPSSGLEKAGEKAATAELGDLERDGADAGMPVALTGTVTVGGAG